MVVVVVMVVEQVPLHLLLLDVEYFADET